MTTIAVSAAKPRPPCQLRSRYHGTGGGPIRDPDLRRWLRRRRWRWRELVEQRARVIRRVHGGEPGVGLPGLLGQPGRAVLVRDDVEEHDVVDIDELREPLNAHLGADNRIRGGDNRDPRAVRLAAGEQRCIRDVLHQRRVLRDVDDDPARPAIRAGELHEVLARIDRELAGRVAALATVDPHAPGAADVDLARAGRQLRALERGHDLGQQIVRELEVRHEPLDQHEVRARVLRLAGAELRDAAHEHEVGERPDRDLRRHRVELIDAVGGRGERVLDVVLVEVRARGPQIVVRVGEDADLFRHDVVLEPVLVVGIADPAQPRVLIERGVEPLDLVDGDRMLGQIEVDDRDRPAIRARGRDHPGEDDARERGTAQHSPLV